MATKQFYFDGVKSIPISQLPEEAWRTFVGQDAARGDAYRMFHAVPWLYRGVTARCDAMAAMPYTLYRGKEEIEDIETELPWMGKFAHLLWQTEGAFALYGASYWFVERNVVRIKKVRWLYPQSVRPEIDEEKGLTGFTRQLKTREKKYELKDILYFWLPSLREEIGPGIPPAAVALEAAGLIRNADEFASGFFKRGAIQPMIVSMEQGTAPTETKRMEDWFQKVATGLKNAFRAIAVSGKMDVTTVGQPLNELAMPELNQSKREDIATALGVPHSLLFSNAANYATAQQDDLHFYTKTVIPDAELIEDALNEQLFKDLGYRLQFQPEKLEVFQQLEAQKAEKLAVLLDRGVITVDEAREQLGYGPKPIEQKPEPPPIPTATEEPEPEDGEEVGDEMAEMFKADIGRWRRKALKMLKEGKPGKMIDFTSDVVSPGILGAVKGALEAALTRDAVNGVFADALQWSAYP